MRCWVSQRTYFSPALNYSTSALQNPHVTSFLSCFYHHWSWWSFFFFWANNPHVLFSYLNVLPLLPNTSIPHIYAEAGRHTRKLEIRLSSWSRVRHCLHIISATSLYFENKHRRYRNGRSKLISFFLSWILMLLEMSGFK